MGNHIALSVLATSLGVSSQEAAEKCHDLGVPIVHGRVDKSFFALAVAADEDALVSTRPALGAGDA
jgi:hypothetical protein